MISKINMERGTEYLKYVLTSKQKIFLIRLKRQHKTNVDHVPVYPNKFILSNHITSLRILTKLTILKIEKLYNSILQN